MTKKELKARLDLAEELISVATSVLSPVESVVNIDEDESLADSLFGILNKMFTNETSSISVCNMILTDEELGELFSEEDEMSIPYPHIKVDRNDPHNIKIMQDVASEDGKFLGDKLIVTTEKLGDTVEQSLVYRSMYSKKHTIAKTSVIGEDVDVSVYSLHDEYSPDDEFTITREEILALEGEFLKAGDCLLYEKDGTTYLSPITDINDDGQARILLNGAFHLVGTEELKPAEDISEELRNRKRCISDRFNSSRTQANSLPKFSYISCVIRQSKSALCAPV